MKKIIFILSSLMFVTLAINAKSANEIRIYLNPGHGSWGPDDRPCATIPYPMLASTGRADTCGFYESNTNLWKMIHLGDKLIENGFLSKNVVFSRRKNGPFPYVKGASDASKYNKNLSEICEEVEAGNFDMFLSVHSNAATDGSITNYGLFLYRGYDDGTGAVDGAKTMAKTVWPYIQTNGIDYYTYYSPTKPNVRGDIDFYHSSSTATRSNGKKYTGYLGVLKHGVPGFLSEGYFHTYQPARHRALNRDYCYQEGVRYLRGILDYFNLPSEKVGYIMGTVKDSKNTISHTYYSYEAGTDDQYFPINGAKVSLLKNGTVVREYHTDYNYNGVFVFDDLEPGTYTLDCSADNYNDLTSNYKKSITVKANATTYSKLYLTAQSGYTPNTDPTNEITEHVNYAYNLSATPDNGNINLAFSSTGKAKTGTITMTNTATNVETTFPISTVKKGENTLEIDTAALHQGTFSWSVQVESDPITEARAFFKLGNTTSGSGVTVNTNPEVRSFGHIYFSDCYNTKGIYHLAPDLSTVNSTALFTNSFTGDNYSPGRMATNPNNGYVFISDWSDSHSGIFYFLPLTTSPSLVSFLKGSRFSTGIIKDGSDVQGGSTSGIAFTGTGDDTKLYAFVQDYPEADGNQLVRYDIAKKYSWYQVPSASFSSASDLLLNHNVNIAGDENGVWLAQIRNSGNNSAAVPSFIYMNHNGDVLYNSGTSLTSLKGSNGSGLAVNKENNILAVADESGAIEIFGITWNLGIPTLSYKYTIASNDGAVGQMAFDFAGNLYTSARYGNKGYVLPNDKPLVTTPASATITIDYPSAIKSAQTSTQFAVSQDIDGQSLKIEGNGESAAVYNLNGILLKKVQMAAGKGSVNISTLPHGVYFVKMGHQTISFLHK